VFGVIVVGRPGLPLVEMASAHADERTFEPTPVADRIRATLVADSLHFRVRALGLRATGTP